MTRLVEWIRRKNRARLQRRRELRASGQVPRGFFPRLVWKLKAKNHERLARRRLRTQLLASLAANDTAVLEALVFLLKASRQDQRARAEADEALGKRLAGLEDRLDGGLRLLNARLQLMESRLPAARGPLAGDAVPVNGDLRRAHGQASPVAERGEPAERADGEPGARHA